MNKFEELEKIKSLKDKGSITEQEFEIEKQKILNSDNSSSTTKTTEGIYTASLILGIFSFIFAIVPILGLILSIIGLVISIKSRKKLKINNEKKGTVTAGFILSIVGLIISILSIILILLGISVAILNGENGTLTKVEQASELSRIQEEKETSKIEVGTNYNYNDDYTIAFIRFNTETDFIMEIGYVHSEKFTKTGTYSVNQDTIKLTVNYDSEYIGYSELEEQFKPYTEEIIILEDEKLQYTTQYGATLIFEKGTSNSFENITDTSTTNFSDETQSTESNNNSNPTSNTYSRSSNNNDNNNYENKTVNFKIHKVCLIKKYMEICEQKGINQQLEQFRFSFKANDKVIANETIPKSKIEQMIKESVTNQYALQNNEIISPLIISIFLENNSCLNTINATYTGNGIFDIKLYINDVIIVDCSCDFYNGFDTRNIKSNDVTMVEPIYNRYSDSYEIWAYGHGPTG